MALTDPVELDMPGRPAAPAEPAARTETTDSARPAQFGITQALILMNGSGVLFWVVWQFSQLESKSSKDAFAAGYCCGFVVSMTWILMWSE